MAESLGLPQNLTYERLVIGACLLYDDVASKTLHLLEIGEFCLDKHQRMWRAMSSVYAAGSPVNAATVATELSKSGDLQACDGLSGLIDITEGVPEFTDLSHYVAGIKECATLRAIMASAQDLLNRAQSCQEGSQSILDAMGQVSASMAPPASSQGSETIGEIIDRVGLDAIMKPRTEMGLRFPWGWMNNRTGGMGPAELWILAGHTSTGKTTAMLQHAVNAAMSGKRVMIFSLEVGKESLVWKAAHHRAGINIEHAKRGQLGPGQIKLRNEAAYDLSQTKLTINTQCTTTAAIHAAVRQARVKGPVDHVIVDYLQLLGNTGRYESRANAVGANAWAMKMLASEFGIPVLLLSQFNRSSNKPGQERPPDLTDLKESGDIENHANGVWFIHREKKEDSDQVQVKFMLPKQREGRRDVNSDFWFYPLRQRFEQMEKEEQ